MANLNDGLVKRDSFVSYCLKLAAFKQTIVKVKHKMWLTKIKKADAKYSKPLLAAVSEEKHEAPGEGKLTPTTVNHGNQCGSEAFFNSCFM